MAKPKRYSKVSMELWGDDKFTALTPLRPSGQALWLYLLLSPYRCIIPGLTLNIGFGTLADRLPTWGAAAVRKHWEEIEGQRMAKADWRAGVIWLPKAIAHNEPESPNVIRSWAKVPLPKCDLIAEALDTLRRYIDSSLGEAFIEAFDEGFSSSFGESGTRALTEAGSTPPVPPALRGVEVSRKPPTRDERKWAKQFYQARRDARISACPHTPECEYSLICLGRVVQDKRWAEAHGQRMSLEEAS